MNELIIRDDIVNGNHKHMIGGGVISEGGYGCVFHPKITCNGKQTSNTNYISKIQKDNFYSNNELYISSIIKSIIIGIFLSMSYKILSGLISK